ncbi:MAG: copper chaperone PCu(A)C [Bosea sp.]|nr:copper chaperone PCu(A)C [Bosea sp. (in: a-proteobacteria)]
MIANWLARLGSALGTGTPQLLSRGAVLRALAIAATGLGSFIYLGTAHREPVAKRADIGIVHPWSWGAARAGEQYPFYASFENDGRLLDQLIAVETPVAREAVMQQLDRSSGIVRPLELDELAVPGNSRITLRPGLRQITLVGLKQAVEPGMTIPVTFVFSRAGRVPAQVQVENLGQPQHADHS